MRKPCCEKTTTASSSNKAVMMNKGAWSKQEDQKLIDYIHNHGEGCWRSLPQAAGLQRCGKSCRLRWVNYLRPDLKRGSFGEDEEDLIIKLHALLGNRWSLIAGRLPGRTDNEVKNYWNTHLRKKLQRMGINPNNHRLAAPHNHTVGHYCCNNNKQVLSPRTSSNNEDSGSVSRATVEPTESNATSSHQLIPDLNLDLSVAPPNLMVEEDII